ncbi:MAG: SDR family NAD(P)-dependent oxidoreductase [Gammaproteobacteria bacterium]
MTTRLSGTAAKMPGREPIAIIGMGCRFPGGSDTPNAFWRLLRDAEVAITDVPADRWDHRRYYDSDPEKPGKIYVSKGGFLRESIHEFDPLFFGISPREAPYIDPQQRLLLEVAWEALEDAGIPPDGLAGSDTGVYIGAFTLDHKLTQMGSANRDQIRSHTAVGSTMTILSNRVSYTLDLRGPSVSMDTACSSSLVATHFACQALWAGDCGMALAGGVNCIFRPEYMIAMCKGKFLSPDGYSKSFDHRANGYARGEGAGIVVLKPLSAALRDGDDVYALIRGTGVNQDGRTEGITVPSPQAQETLIRQVCRKADVLPAHIRYFEAHGTGTGVGDPIEAQALGAAVGRGRSGEAACVVGSVKANIGHLEAASGVAGLVKAALCLRHQEIPPLANLDRPNPAIPFSDLGLRLPRDLEPMPNGGDPVYVGVNSFGYGGTNAHVILEEPPRSHHPEGTGTPPGEAPLFLPLSARSPHALVASCERIADRLRDLPEASLHDLCYSASVRRMHHDHRVAVIGADATELLTGLEAIVAQGAERLPTAGTVPIGLDPRPVFVLTGMGPQWWAMGRELLRSEAVFREAAEDCDRIFQRLSGWSILSEMRADEAESRIRETQIAQPANLVLQVALVALLRARGIEPAAVVGHSVGEVAAAYVAGVLCLEEAVFVSYHRSRIQKKAAGRGTMLAVGLSQDEAAPLLDRNGTSVSIAAVNSPSAVTLAGDEVSLRAIAAAVETRGIFNRVLQVEVAYHSPYMDPLRDEIVETFAGLVPKVPSIPLYSTVTGQRVEGVAYDADYWWHNVRQAVLFAHATEALIGDGYRTFLEIGPHPVLSTSIKQCLAKRGVPGHVIPSLRRERPEHKAVFEAIGTLYTAGHAMDWQRFFPQGGRYLRLPTYPWQRDTYWVESAEARLDRVGNPGEHIFLEQALSAPRPTWETPLNRYLLPYLEDHRVDGLVVFPGAGYVEAGLAAHRHLHGEGPCALEDLDFIQALVIEEGDEPVLRVDADKDRREYSVFSRTRDDRSTWRLHARGRLAPERLPAAPVLDTRAIRARCTEAVDVGTLYRGLEGRGLGYGPWFRGIQALYRAEAEVWARITPPPGATVEAFYHLHPTLLDACFQALLAVLDGGPEGERPLYLPVHIDQVRLYRQLTGSFWCHGVITDRSPEAIEGDLILSGADGETLVEVRGLACRRVASGKGRGLDDLDQWLYHFAWEAAEAPVMTGTPGRWLVFMDNGGIGAATAEGLRANGASEVSCVAIGDAYQERHGRWQVRRGHCEDLARLWEAVDPGTCDGIVYLWTLDASIDGADPIGCADAQHFLALLQGIAAVAHERAPRLYVVTAGAARVVPGEAVTSPAMAPTVGLARVAYNEYPELRCTLVDLPARPATEDLTALVGELLADDREDDVALRGTSRFVHRLVRTDGRALDAAAGAVATALAEPGTAFELKGLGRPDAPRFTAAGRRAPAAGEVEVEIHTLVLDPGAAAAASRPRADDAGTPMPGREMVGVVARLGEGIHDLRPGDTVLAFAPVGVRSHACVARHRVFRIPAGLEISGTGGSLSTLVTAYYQLTRVAHLGAGQIVLIQGAESVLGRAAIAIARALQAEVWVTGTGVPKPDVQDTELSTRLGITQILDAQGLDFTEKVLSLSHGNGIDVLVNVGGPSLDASYPRVMAPFGRVIHSGPGAVVYQRRSPSGGGNLVIAHVDMDALIAERPALFQEVLDELCTRMPASLFTVPSAPHFALADIAQAFERLSAMRTEITVSLRGEPVAVEVAPDRVPLFRADASYLVTGGLGGFGLRVAEWLVTQGARHLVLVGRRGAATPEARAAVKTLEQAGTSVSVVAADVAIEAEVRRMLAETAATMPPLRGVFHSAAVLDDRPLAEMDEDSLKRVLLPKALGAWHLHRHCKELDHFVMFSSVSAIIGNARQGNYVAGNLFLDALAAYRRTLGSPAISINWGALSQLGMTAANTDVEKHLALMGMKPFSANQALRLLDRVLRWDPVQLGVMDVDWVRWARFEPNGGESPRFMALTGKDGRGEETGAAQGLREELLKLELPERRELLTLLVAEQIAETLRWPTDKLDLNQSLTQLGLDSLLAVELQTAIGAKFGIEVSTLELMRGTTIAHLSDGFLTKMGIAEHGRGQEETAATDRDIEGLSDEALDQLLDRMIVQEGI